MKYLLELIFTAPGLIAAGGIGALTLEHGWGWVLAQYKAYKAKAQADLSTVSAQVNAATAGMSADIAALKNAMAKIPESLTALQNDISALKAKVGL